MLAVKKLDEALFRLRAGGGVERWHLGASVGGDRDLALRRLGDDDIVHALYYA